MKKLAILTVFALGACAPMATNTGVSPSQGNSTTPAALSKPAVPSMTLAELNSSEEQSRYLYIMGVMDSVAAAGTLDPQISATYFQPRCMNGSTNGQVYAAIKDSDPKQKVHTLVANYFKSRCGA